jgi:hypothetical protein
MHIIETKEGTAAREAAALGAPFGAGFPPDIVGKTEKLEVWGSGANDPGPDYCEFRAFDGTGTQISTKRVAGY